MRCHRRYRRRAVATVLLCAAALLLAGLGDAAELDGHEVLVAQTAREMRSSGDWLIPTFNGAVRLQKPPLAYWTTCSAAVLTGGVDAFASRLPQALATLLGVGWLMWVVTRWAGLRLGLPCGVVQATSYWTLAAGRSATVDATLATLVLLAVTLAVADRWAPPWLRRPAVASLAFWTCCGLAVLAKGPVGLCVVFPVALYGRLRLGTARWRADPVCRIGLVWFAVLSLAWPTAVWWFRPDAVDLWLGQSAGRYLSHWGPQTRPWFYYLYQIPLMTLPWTPLWLYGLARATGPHAGRTPLRRVTRRSGAGGSPRSEGASALLWARIRMSLRAARHFRAGGNPGSERASRGFLAVFEGYARLRRSLGRVRWSARVLGVRALAGGSPCHEQGVDRPEAGCRLECGDSHACAPGCQGQRRRPAERPIVSAARTVSVPTSSSFLGGADPPFHRSLPCDPQTAGSPTRHSPRDRHADLLRLATVWFLWGLAFFSLSAGKREHYVLPILPPLAVLAAAALPGLADRLRRIDTSALDRGLRFAALPVGAAAWVVAERSAAGLGAAVGAAATLVLFGAPAVGRWLRRPTDLGRLAVAGALLVLAVACVRTGVQPALANRPATAAMLSRNRQRLAGADRIVQLGMTDRRDRVRLPSAVPVRWVRRGEDPAAAWGEGRVLLLVAGHRWPELSARHGLLLLDRPTGARSLRERDPAERLILAALPTGAVR